MRPDICINLLDCYSYSIRINDTFDFDVDDNYDDLFTSCVNNWAWLCQQTHILNKISVNIYMQ